jgi:tryptophanyl-tRNA synthetase
MKLLQLPELDVRRNFLNSVLRWKLSFISIILGPFHQFQTFFMSFPKRILTGDRPTGKLHLGHYVGSIKNRVQLQEKMETLIVIADLHMLTTKPDSNSISKLGENCRDMTLDYLACGIDPSKANIYLQSAVSEIYELNLIFEMLVSVNRLSRLPSLKDMVKSSNMSEDSMPFGLLGYPVLQAADILLPMATLVPVGKDNEAHLEITREIARRFNHLYGEIFPEPESMIGNVPTLMGIDGSGKMSKSLNNCIYLSDDENTVRKKVKSMYTDPKRIHANIPGTVEGNPVFQYLDAFCEDLALVDGLKERYRAGTVGDGEVKDRLFEALETFLSPLRDKRYALADDRGYVDQVIVDGTAKMKELAFENMKNIRKAMGLHGNWNKIRRSAEKRSKKLKN